ncbi:MAG: hypothetical protein ACRDFW_06275 [bacterium]
MRQAVIVIHGIGEQKPMDTLRGLVDAVIPAPAEATAVKFHSKPDRMSESFELRKLLVPQSRKRPITDFFEYYWAFHVHGTKYAHLGSWLKSLLVRKPREVPRRLLPIWLVTWGLLFVAAVEAVVAVARPDTSASFLPERWSTTPLVPILLVPLVNVLVLRWVGDAARYLSPTPGNIATRRRIRADAIALLRRIHRSKEYDRVVLIGHSLGSVIAYDLLKHFWQEVHAGHGRPLDVDQSALKKVETAGRSLTVNSSDEEVGQFQELQRALWLEQRRHGFPMLVTDLVTLGSPLTHAELLFANSRAELAARRREMELPTCPPHATDGGGYSFHSAPYEVQGQKRTIRILHHAAPFACTRWTNVYFPGDLVGGPLRPLFGAGIRDVCASGSGLEGWIAWTPLSHVRYWRHETAGTALRLDSALMVLRSALDLESRPWLQELRSGAKRQMPSRGEGGVGRE